MTRRRYFEGRGGVPLGFENLTLSQCARLTKNTPCHNIPYKKIKIKWIWAYFAKFHNYWSVTILNHELLFIYEGTIMVNLPSIAVVVSLISSVANSSMIVVVSPDPSIVVTSLSDDDDMITSLSDDCRYQGYHTVSYKINWSLRCEGRETHFYTEKQTYEYHFPVYH